MKELFLAISIIIAFSVLAQTSLKPESKAEISSNNAPQSLLTLRQQNSKNFKQRLQ